MKDKDTRSLKPLYIQEASFSARDEINLVDLAVVLVRHKITFACTLIVFVIFGITIALFTPKTYAFSTTLDIGSRLINASIIPFESPQALAAKLQYSYIPQVLIKHRQLHPADEKKYWIKTTALTDSNIVLLEIEGNIDQSDALIELLQSASQKAIFDHGHLFQSIKNNLETRMKQAQTTLKTLKNSKNNETEVSSTQNIIESLSSQLANLRSTRQLLSPIRSIEPTDNSKILIVTIFILSGIFLGILAVFFTEFLSKVKQRIGEKSN